MFFRVRSRESLELSLNSASAGQFFNDSLSETLFFSGKTPESLELSSNSASAGCFFEDSSSQTLFFQRHPCEASGALPGAPQNLFDAP